MKIIQYLNKFIKKLFVLALISVFFTSQFNSHVVKAMNIDNFQDPIITEELRLKVPSAYREAWLRAEKKIWDPWLSSKDGFWGDNYFGIKKEKRL